jgi:four helix bundle protein
MTTDSISNTQHSTPNIQVKGRFFAWKGPSKRRNAMGRKYDLEDRLIDFAGRAIDVVEALPETRTGNHVASQLLRCGTAPGPNYGEAQSAESQSDFIHKLKVALKELRETCIWLKLIQRKELIKPTTRLSAILRECDELILIFFSSIRTARKNMERAQKPE